MKKRLKIAQIGTGHDHAYWAMRALTDLNGDLFDFVGYAVTPGDEVMYRHSKPEYSHLKEYSVEELLSIPDLDAVVIETTELASVKYAKMAAERGLHVHLDKPGNESSEDFCELLAEIKKRGLILSMGYMYRLNPVIQKALQTAKSGKIGEIYSVEAHMSCDHPLEKRKWLSSFQGGMSFFLGCHLTDLIYTLQGTPEEIMPCNCPTNIKGETGNDFSMAVFRYKNGYSFYKTTAVEKGGFQRRQLVICGTKGTIEVKPLEEDSEKGGEWKKTRAVYYYLKDGVECSWHAETEEWEGETKRYSPMFVDFYNRIVSGEQGEYSLNYEARLHRLVLATCGIECDYKENIEI